MTKLRKALITSLSVITILSMSMIAVPFQADAASAGDLIKIDGYAPVYYLGDDMKRYVFPNEATYFSWYSDFSSVVTLDQAEVESYPLAANVVVRPGTRLVKRPVPTDPKVYAVEPNGTLRWVPDEATAVNLYGDDWAQRVVDIVDSFFVNYSISTNDVDADMYPAGSLVRFAGEADVYYINADGEAQKIADEAAFNANRFNWDDVLVAPTDMDKPAMGDEITGKTSAADTAQGGNSGTGPVVTPGAGSGLSVALASDTPSSKSIPSGANLVPFTTVNFTASNDGDVTIRDLTFHRVGTGPTTDIDGGYLYVDGERLTNKKTVNSTDHKMTFNGVNLKVNSGSTESVTLMINGNSGDKTGNHAFELETASAVVTNGATVSGSFPVRGNTMSYSAVDAGSVTFNGDNSARSYDVGETNVVLAEFDIQTNSSEDVNVFRIRLKNSGTAGDDAISNISLEIDGDMVMENVSMEDDYVDFMMDNPYLIEKSKTVTATVRGDIVGDPGKNVIFYLRNDADVDVRGTAYGDFYSAAVVRTAFDETGDTSTVSINGSDINISFDGPAADDVRDDRDDVVFANFKISTAGDGVQIDTFPIHLYMEGSVSGGAADNLDNFELVDETNNVTYTVSDSTASSSDTTYNFEDVTLQEGVDYNFEIRGDIPADASTGRIYRVGFVASEVVGATYISSDENVDSDAWSATTLTGKNMTVASPSVTFSKVATNNATYVKDADGVLLYKGKITASGVDDLSVRKVKLDATVGGASTYLDDDYEKLYFYYINEDGDEVLLDDETSLTDVAAVTFSSFKTELDIPAGTSNGVYVVVRGDVKTNVLGGTVAFAWASASVSDFQVKDSDNNTFTIGQYTVSTDDGHTTTIASNGTYTLAVDTELTGLNQNQNVLAGGVRLLGRLKATADKEDARIEDLVLQATSTSGTAINNSDIGTLYLYADKEMTDLLGTADFAAGTNPKALFEDVNIEIPTSGSTYLYVGGLVKGVDYSSSPTADATATAGRKAVLTIPADATGYTTKVVGVDTGETLSNTYSSTKTNVSTVLGAKISNIASDFANDTLTIGKQDIFSFKVTAPNSSNVDYDGDPLGVKLATTTFSLAMTSGLDLTNVWVERVGGNGEQTASVSTTTTSIVLDFGATYGTDSDLIVEPGETAEYIIKGYVTGVGTSDSLKVSIESLSSNFSYTHHTGTDGVQGADLTAVNPLISGLTSVSGGSLSN